MVSSLASDVRNACAAYRAGLSRSSELPYRVRSTADGKPENVIGHPAHNITHGFQQSARLIRLAQAGLVNLKLQDPTAPTARDFYASFPSPVRIFTGNDLIDDPGAKAAHRAGHSKAQEEQLDSDAQADIINRAAQLAGWATKPETRFISLAGNTGVAEALRRASSDLHSGAVPAAIVCGIDSLLDEEVLTWLQNTGRLKNSGLASGLQPGESAVFLLLETQKTASKRSAPIYGRAQAITFAREPNPLLSGNQSSGRGLVELLAGWNASQSGTADSVWLITDQNGETYRSMEWGRALVQMITAAPVFKDTVLWYPATGFGETGAANGGVAIAAACFAFKRGYSPSKEALVLSCGEGEERALISLSA
jgi:3-oxoacyl-[acyl-carrier-protein] synthase-1